ncbi:MAG: Deoxyribose-phosphate aldolase [Eubacteriales bacterium SKADARSKE-1]|nr:Deoxyribose-phosphate aldolase [Eubacteriales bacterium SKADARSKE-1]
MKVNCKTRLKFDIYNFFERAINMDIKEILKKVDHTLLSQTATFNEIKTICDDAIKYGVASVCIAPSFVKRAKEYTKGAISICTVIGFPNGYSTTATKVFEAEDAIKNGADEIDMVINLGYVKEGLYKEQLDEIKKVKEACGNKVLKVIIETCLLTDEEKIKMCEVVTESGADFIKTSTGFSTSGATFDDIALFAKYVGKNVKIKAAGGISSINDAEKFISLGASRLGTSRIVKIVKEK